jgi:hypothetical protein
MTATELSDTSRGLGAVRVRALAVGALSVGALAVGAIAVGALALGAVAIGRLVIGRARSSLTISAKSVGVGAASQPWIPRGE